MITKRLLGTNGPEVGCLGYGAMVLEGYYGSFDDDDRGVRTIRHAIEAGMMIDTSDAYGDGHNEELVGRAIKDRRGRAFIATKFGIVFDRDESYTDRPMGWPGFSLKVNGTPRYVRKALDASLKRLGTDVIDLWYVHQIDPSTPIEETVGAMADGVHAGKVRYLGLSNVTAQQVERAHAVYPISAVQNEYSLWRREAEADLLPTLRRLGIALVAWSPLGCGFLAGTVDGLDEKDFRLNNPRFVGETLAVNRRRFEPFFGVAAELGVTPAQLALAWLLSKGEDVIPIPGTRRPDRVDENAGAAAIALDPKTLARINALARPGLAEGATLV
jgi:aryl-alcohol dehydrogenase-like predicted oxidoreductase